MKLRLAVISLALFLAACASEEEQRLIEQRDEIYAVGGFELHDTRPHGFVTRSNPCGENHTLSQEIFTREAPDANLDPPGHPREIAAPMAEYLEMEAVELERYERVRDGTVSARQILWRTESSAHSILFISDISVTIRLVAHPNRSAECPAVSLQTAPTGFELVDQFSN